MNAAERAKLLRLHRKAMNAAARYASAADNDPAVWIAATDAFREYLFSLDVTP